MQMSSSKKNVVPQAREALDRFKMEAAAEVGVNLSNGYNGGQMVKKMIESYEKNMK